MKKSVNKTITIRDIALSCQVSPSTVSNILSGKRQVNSAAGKKVLAYAEKIGYQKIHQQRFKKAIHLILFRKHKLILCDTPVFSALVTALDNCCKAQGYALSLSYIDALTLGEKATQKTISQIVSDPTTPILLLATEMSEQDFHLFENAKAPIMVIGNLLPKVPFNIIDTDNFEAGRIAVQHLIDKGHTHIGIISSSVPFDSAKKRKQGALYALQEHDFPIKAEDILYLSPFAEETSDNMTQVIQNRKEQFPTAFFAINDYLALGAMHALIQHGFSIPKDISLIGMDNMPFDCLVSPKLSTIEAPIEETARQAVLRLIALTQETEQYIMKSYMGVKLVERDSVLDLNTCK